MALPIATAPDLGGDDASFVRAAVAEEVRSALARKRMSGAELARRLHKSEAWVSRRISLNPTQTFDVVELTLVASHLGVTVKELIPDPFVRWSMENPGDRPLLSECEPCRGQLELAFSGRPSLTIASVSS